MKDEESKIVEQLKIIAAWLFVIWLALICTMILNIVSANAADYAIVSFNSPEHLAALQDSVVGVCDTTTGIDTVKMSSATMDSSKWVYSNVTVIRVDTVAVDTMYWVYCEITHPIITCRQLVSVTARWPRTELKWLPPERDYPKMYLRGQEINIPMEWREVFIPGEAIIFYEPYKEE